MEKNKTNQFDRMAFLRKVIDNFINKNNFSYTSLKSAYDGFISLINKDTDLHPEHKEQNQEKKKILEKCFDIFNDSNFKTKLRDIKGESNLDPKRLVPIITRGLAEQIIGDKKRQYNMSKRFSPNLIDGAKFKPFDGQTVSVSDNFKNTFVISQIGTLYYSSLGIKNESINKYKVQKILNNNTILEYEIFSYIDLNMLTENESYKEAVLGELLSQNNVELSNACGYVGEIVSTKNYPKKLQVGQESENEEKFYRYQATEDHALIFDPQDFSAVVYNLRQQSADNKSDKQSEKPQDDAR